METAVVVAISTFVGGLIMKVWEYVTTGRRAAFISDAKEVVELWRLQGVELQKEVVELKLEVQKLQTLVGAFESELVALGADRDRINAIKYGAAGGMQGV